jgi:hypothetical protein
MKTRFPNVILVILLLNGANPLFAQPVEKDAYHDFRNKRPPDNAFRFGGLDPDGEMTAENEGLRITLPAERERHLLSEVNVGFPVVGDFEFTATYEILSAKPPIKGYGIGVNLTISTVAEPKKFGKLCRVLRPKEGNVYLAETWHKYRKHVKNTESMSGQLRLARIGPTLNYLVSEGPGKAFEPIWEVADYGGDEIGYAGFQVSDSGEPGNPIDARLIDLRMRLGKIDREKTTAPAALAVAAPLEIEPIADPIAERSVPIHLRALGCVASALLMVMLVVGAIVLLRRRARSDVP